MWKFFISLLFIPIALFAEFSADISISNDEMSIYDLLEMHVVLTHPEHYHPEINTIRGNLLQHRALTEPPFVLVSSDIKKHQGKTVLTFTLEPQTVGDHTIALYEIPFVSADGERVELISGLYQVKVALPSKTGVDIKPMLASLENEYPIEIDTLNRNQLTKNMNGIKQANLLIYQSKTLPWEIFIGISLFSLLYLIARQQPEILSSRTVSEAIKRTRAKKAALNKLTKLTSIDSMDAYYVNLTNTIREYIEEYYDLPATTTTTEEFLQKMTSHPIFDPSTQKSLSNFLINSDQVKFAEHEPSPNEREKALQSAEHFIKNIHL